jgi:hypothetical protein
MAKLYVIPMLPLPKRRIPAVPGSGKAYIEGQRVLVEAIKYLAKDDPERNRPAVELLSEHFRTQFRMTDRPH